MCVKVIWAGIVYIILVEVGYWVGIVGLKGFIKYIFSFSYCFLWVLCLFVI